MSGNELNGKKNQNQMLLETFESMLESDVNQRRVFGFSGKIFQVREMAASKYKNSLKTKMNSEHYAALSSLKTENAYLKKALAELSHQHSQHYKLVETFLSPKTLLLKISQTTEGGNASLSSDQQCQEESNPVDADSSANAEASTSDETLLGLQNNLQDALEKNRQWQEYDQCYVRGILARMFWLEMQLNEANEARLQQHNEGHSEETEKMKEMQENYERIFKKAREHQDVLREMVDSAHQNLTVTRNLYEEKDREVKELKELLESERMSRNTENNHSYSEDDEELVSLKYRQDVEKRQSGDIELKNYQRTRRSSEGMQPAFQCSRRASTPCGSLLDESILACPKCFAKYPASHYRQLMNHIDVCLE